LGKELKSTTQRGIDCLEVALGELTDVMRDNLRTVVREEAKDVKEKLGEIHQSIERHSSTAASSQSAGGKLNVLSLN